MNERQNLHDSQSMVVCRNFFGLWRLKHLKIRITYRERRSNFSRRDRKPILEKKKRKLYKKWLITRNYVFVNKYKLYCNKIAIINKIYRDCFYNDILIKSDNTKKMWDNINLLINKKRPSSHMEKLQVDNKRYEQTISNCLNDFFCNVPSTLAAQLPKSDKSATSYLSQKQKQFRFT